MNRPTIARLVEESYNHKLPAYAWPGGYPIVYLDMSNDTYCPDCAQAALDNPDEFDDYKPHDWFVYWEGLPIECAECGTQIESAYGDPDEEGA